MGGGKTPTQNCSKVAACRMGEEKKNLESCRGITRQRFFSRPSILSRLWVPRSGRFSLFESISVFCSLFKGKRRGWGKPTICFEHCSL